MNGNILNYTFSGMKAIEERDNANIYPEQNHFFKLSYTPVLNEKNNNLYYYHQNELNSVEAITNQQGRLLEKYDYDVYGKMSIYDSLNNPFPVHLRATVLGLPARCMTALPAIINFFSGNIILQQGCLISGI